MLDKSKDSDTIVTRFIATTDQSITPVHFLVECKYPVTEVSGSIVGAGAEMHGGWGGRFSDNMIGFTIVTPAWTPSDPMIVSVRSKQDIGICRFSLRP